MMQRKNCHLIERQFAAICLLSHYHYNIGRWKNIGDILGSRKTRSIFFTREERRDEGGSGLCYLQNRCPIVDNDDDFSLVGV